jgi:hypothetical protein
MVVDHVSPAPPDPNIPLYSLMIANGIMGKPREGKHQTRAARPATKPPLRLRLAGWYFSDPERERVRNSEFFQLFLASNLNLVDLARRTVG